MQLLVPVNSDPIEDFKEFGTLIFFVEADPSASAASTMDSALIVAFSLAATADSAAASAADAALVAALRAAPKKPPPIDDKPGFLDIFQVFNITFNKEMYSGFFCLICISLGIFHAITLSAFYVFVFETVNRLRSFDVTKLL